MALDDAVLAVLLAVCPGLAARREDALLLDVPLKRWERWEVGGGGRREERFRLELSRRHLENRLIFE